MKHVARKRFGQHFLVDEGVLDRLVDAIDPRPHQRLVEIGPGLGALTRPLLARAGQLTVVELDRDLAARLRGIAGLTVVEGDALRIDFTALAGSQRLRIVGNLPYNISTPLLFHLLGAAAGIVDQHFMLQKEVVDRIVAAPGSKDYGRLSVMLQWRYRVESLFDVPPQAFDPPPRVESAIVRMRTRDDARPLDAVCLEEVVRVAFSQRRKLLRHTLGRWLAARGAAVEFDLQRRAEEVPVADYLGLVEALG